MEEQTRLRSYFKEQVRQVIEQSVSEPDGFLSYFVDHEPKDEEILGLLAVTTMIGCEDVKSDSFPTSVEALAALSPSRQAEICHEFRKQLKNRLSKISAA